MNIELAEPNLDPACYGHPPLPPSIIASNGPARACIVNKIDQFAAELAAPRTDPEDRLTALKFPLHLVGNLHQPLHAADDHDAGGNRKRVVAEGFPPGNLHHFWDVEFVERLGTDPREIANAITAPISDEQRAAWSGGSPINWAIETFGVARDDAYGKLPKPSPRGVYALDRRYIDVAIQDVRLQLGKASVRRSLYC